MNKIKQFLCFYFVEPFNEIKIKKADNHNESPLWRFFYACFLVISLILMLCLCTTAGTSGDEFFHVDHSKNVLNFYKTSGSDSTAAVVTSKYNLPYYGQSPDTFSSILISVFHPNDYMQVRHTVNTIIGWLAILFASLIAKRIGGWRSAMITALLLFISPRFLGHSFNNLKDIPFASSIIMCIYFIMKFLDELPKIKKSTSICLALAIAFSLSVRIGGLIVFAYFGLFAIIYYIYKRKELKGNFKKTLIWSLGICIVAYILMVIVWPYALTAPIDHPKEAFQNMNKFATSLRQIFEGQRVWSDTLPYYYTPKFILMTIPTIVILGFILSLAFLKKNKKQWFHYTFLIFTFVFPVFWIVVNKSNVYGGWRHSMFVYPPMVVLAGLGISSLIDILKNKYAKSIVMIVLGFMCINPIAFCMRNHPYEYIYFNELEGGMKNAYGKYELDYYYHSIREATQWIIKNGKKDNLNLGKKIIVGSWSISPVDYFLRNDTNRFQSAFVRWSEKGESDWDYAIFCNTGIPPEELQNGSFPPANTVYQVKVDGKPICIVLKRKDKNDFFASQAMKKKDFPNAITHFQKAISFDKKNETALSDLSMLYLQTNRPDSSLIYSNQLLSFSPNDEQALYFKAYATFIKGNTSQAINLCQKIININFKFPAVYSLMANIYIKQNDLISASNYLEKLIDIDRLDNQTMGMLLQIYQAQGLDQANAYVKLYSLFAEHYKKIGNKQAEKQYNDAISNIYGNSNMNKL